jgi:FemAB-related protein (PEP-CTERM system-associated)
MTLTSTRTIPNVTVSGEDSSQEWDGFVNAHRDASGYHLWGWRTVIERTFGHRCDYLAARDGRDICGILPLVFFDTALFGRFAVSLPFVNFGGVVSSTPETASALVERATELAREARASYLELRHVSRQFPTLPGKSHKVEMLLPLADDAGRMWDQLDRRVRNHVRKAQKSDFTTAVGGIELVGEFYDVFATNMRDLGTPVYSKRFFQAVLETFPDRTTIHVVRHGSRPIAAAFAYRFRDIVEIPWASSLVAYRSSSPNSLLYWTAIEDAIQRGCRTFDFGRSTPGEGTYRFKEQWGARPEPLWWEYVLLARQEMPDHSPKNPKFAAAIAAWKHLPVWLTRIVGPPIVRSIP